MKCQNCDCQVSSEFKYSLTNNCCPKCGQSIMTREVKELFSQMERVLEKNENDLGELAVWLVKNYKPETASEEQVANKLNEQVQEQVVEKKKPSPIKTSKEQAPTNERAAMFSKRAGVDKIKFETLIRDIQGSDESYSQNEDYVEGDQNDVTLTDNEINEVVSDLFNEPDNPAITISELQRIQKLEQMANTGSVGMIRRSQ